MRGISMIGVMYPMNHTDSDLDQSLACLMFNVRQALVSLAGATRARQPGNARVSPALIYQFCIIDTLGGGFYNCACVCKL